MSVHLDRTDGTHDGVTLATLPDGSGLYCRPGVGQDGDRLGRLCRAFDEAPAAQPDRNGATSLACGM